MPMICDAGGWLQGDLVQPCPPTRRTSPLETPEPLGVVWHWTGPPWSEEGARALVERISRRGVPFTRRASWHILIDRAGHVLQSASTQIGTWHVGRVARIAGRRRRVNGCLVGIELSNAGRVRFAAGEWRGWPWKPSSPVVPAGEVVRLDGAKWHRYTEPQVAAAEQVLRALVARYGWSREACVWGHRDFDPGRKEDPGPLWAGVILPEILDKV